MATATTDDPVGRRASWLRALVELLLYEEEATGGGARASGPGTGRAGADEDAAAAAHGQSAFTMLQGVKAKTLARVVRDLERRKIGFEGAMGQGCPSIETMLDTIRPLIRRTPTPRRPSLSRLAWRPVEPMLVDDTADGRDLAVPRVWLRPLWGWVCERNGIEAGTLSAELDTLYAEGRREPTADAVDAVAGQAQRLILDTLTEAATDEDALEALVDSVTRSELLPPLMCTRERVVAVLDRLLALLRSRLCFQDPFQSLRMGIDGVLARPGWREDVEVLYDLQKDVERTLRTIGGTPAAGAFFALLGRSVAAPWPLLEALRRHSMMQPGGNRRGLDTHGDSATLALIDDLVERADRLSRRGLDLIHGVAVGREGALAALAAAAACREASGWLHGLFSSGSLDTAGPRYRRLVDIRERLAPQTETVLISKLESLCLDPVSPRWDGWAASDEAFTDVARAATAAALELHRFQTAPDGLRCFTAVKRSLRACTTGLEHWCEESLHRTRKGRPPPPQLIDTAVNVAEIISPGLGDSFRRRLAAAQSAPPAAPIAAE